MNIRSRKIYNAILGVIAIALASCSNDVNVDNNKTLNPNETAKRNVSISTDNANSRSIVSITTGNKWETGDLFFAYNITDSHGVDALRAAGEGYNTELRGEVTCKNGDKLAIFFPYKASPGHNQNQVELSMQTGILSISGTPVSKNQDGTLESLRYFDYSYGVVESVKVNAQGDVKSNAKLHKQYAILELDFKFGSTMLQNIKQLTISNVTEQAIFDIVSGNLKNREVGSITINPSAPLSKFYVAVFPDNAFKPTMKVVTTDNKTYVFNLKNPKNIEKAKAYPFTIAVKEYQPNPPYVVIDNVKWGKYNLQYTPGSTTSGWESGYHLAKNPWDYFYTEDANYPLNRINRRGSIPLNTSSSDIEFDHFRWGDIENAHNLSTSTEYWKSTSSLQKQVSGDKKYGDLAYYASKGSWAVPTVEQFEALLSSTGEYISYYQDDNNRYVYGVFFDPDVPQNLKGKVLDKDNRVLGNSNTNKTYGAFNNKLRQLQKSDFDKGIFFPMAGMYTYGGYLEKPGTQGAYWLDKPVNANQACAFLSYVSERNEAFSGISRNSAKSVMYSIRPIYVGN